MLVVKEYGKAFGIFDTETKSYIKESNSDRPYTRDTVTSAESLRLSLEKRKQQEKQRGQELRLLRHNELEPIRDRVEAEYKDEMGYRRPDWRGYTEDDRKQIQWRKESACQRAQDEHSFALGVAEGKLQMAREIMPVITEIKGVSMRLESAIQ